MSDRPLTLDELERWVLFGGRCRLAECSEDGAVIQLCSCTGELIDQRPTQEPAVIDFVRVGETSER
jgi:hypothetical protein